jgi:hypothetical protein
MTIRKTPLLYCLLASLIAAPFAQEQAVPTPEPMVPPPSLDEKITEALLKGKFHLNARLRYEYADQSNLPDGTPLRDSNAFTFRTRLGYETASFYGFKAMADFEDIRIIGSEDNFNQTGLSGPGRTLIADVRATELNQSWLSYENWDSQAKVGRQRLILDNHRFIGNVGWRQNEQTFDAVTVQNRSLPDTTLFYGYIHQVNRVLSARHPMGRFKSDSHLFNASYAGIPYGKIAAYAYLLDFDNSAANSSATFGGYYAGDHTFDEETDTAINYRAEYAHQVDYGNQPLDYNAHYYRVELGGAHRQFNAGLGYEVLGSDGGRKGFSTPLATLHAFNGWADVFAAATPNAGLRDFYVWAGVDLPYNVPLTFVYHQYNADRGGANFGHEFNVIASRRFGKYFTALTKYAYFDGRDFPVNFDLHRFWAQVEFNF